MLDLTSSQWRIAEATGLWGPATNQFKIQNQKFKIKPGE
jgi:hypothetical protein